MKIIDGIHINEAIKMLQNGETVKNPYFEYANYGIYSSSYIRDIKHGNKIILDYKDYPKETPDEK